MNRTRILLFSVLMLTTASCDYIENPDGDGNLINKSCLDSPPVFEPRDNPQSKVLLEDFTGHRCGNCPRAGEALKALKTAHGDRVVGVAIHSELAGFFTAPMQGDKYTHDFRSALTLAIDNRFGVGPAGIPRGLLNRRAFSGNRLLAHTSWNQHVSTLLALPAKADLQIKSNYTPVDSTLCVFVNVRSLGSLSGTLRLAAYLSENNFINWQKDYSLANEDIPDYSHDYVLRAAVSSIWGSPLNADNLNQNDTTLGFVFKFDPGRWKADNCQIVAFLYEQLSDEIIQAESAPMGQ